MKGRLADRIEHMQEAARNIRSDIGDLDEGQFLADGKTQRAVIEGILVIGEAASKVMGLDPSIAQKHPELWQQFRDASDMRNLLAHEYFRVDPGVVWATVKVHLSALEGLLSAFAAERAADGGGSTGAAPPQSFNPAA